MIWPTVLLQQDKVSKWLLHCSYLSLRPIVTPALKVSYVSSIILIHSLCNFFLQGYDAVQHSSEPPSLAHLALGQSKGLTYSRKKFPEEGLCRRGTRPFHRAPSCKTAGTERKYSCFTEDIFNQGKFFYTILSAWVVANSY